ncbi:transposase (plasmid) [Kitasatospora sp. NBC_00070]|uniref:transposase n=1 Tax=Kitasatospora sp. NBC_00070 TaxID=2975962 RepID=UPI002F90AFEE
MIEARITVTPADGTTRREPWRLVTSLPDPDPDPDRYPARELTDLYHRRWQIETAYFSIEATVLDGRVLRSRSIDGIDQEGYGLLTAYQALIRTADDALTKHHPRRGPNAGKHPQQTQIYTLTIDIQIMENGRASRRRS